MLEPKSKAMLAAKHDAQQRVFVNREAESCCAQIKVALDTILHCHQHYGEQVESESELHEGWGEHTEAYDWQDVSAMLFCGQPDQIRVALTRGVPLARDTIANGLESITLTLAMSSPHISLELTEHAINGYFEGRLICDYVDESQTLTPHPAWDGEQCQLAKILKLDTDLNRAQLDAYDKALQAFAQYLFDDVGNWY